MIHTANLLSRHRTTILLILLLFFACQGYSQIHLVDIKTTKCLQDGFNFKPIYKQTWLNDSILQIETTASANCIGVYNPRIATLGPLLFLAFDEQAPNGLVADCFCVFKNTWKIKGIKKEDKFIVVLNRQISSDYNPRLLDELLRSYSIRDNIYSFYLENAIDKKGLKQGSQKFKTCEGTLVTLYKDGVELTTF